MSFIGLCTCPGQQGLISLSTLKLSVKFEAKLGSLRSFLPFLLMMRGKFKRRNPGCDGIFIILNYLADIDLDIGQDNYDIDKRILKMYLSRS